MRSWRSNIEHMNPISNTEPASVKAQGEVVVAVKQQVHSRLPAECSFSLEQNTGLKYC